MLFMVLLLTGEVNPACLLETRALSCQAPTVTWREEEGYRGEGGGAEGRGGDPAFAAGTHSRVRTVASERSQQRGVGHSLLA